jgi:hypothetical protein
MVLTQHRGIEPDARSGAGYQILDEHVGLSDHAIKQAGIERILQIQVIDCLPRFSQAK